jgi:pimeloyl-ACP methyl ester carboxylesterase
MATPVVFVHGLWVHATAWQPWEGLFRDAGYDPVSPPWPGDGETVADSRAHPERIAGPGVDAVVAHFAEVIGTLPAKPVVVGHSFGGLVVQRLLGQGLAAAGVAIDSAPVKGVLGLPLSSLRVASAVLRNPLNRGRAVSLSRERFRYGFGNAVSEAESDALWERWTIPAPGRPLFEAAFATLSPRSPTRVDTGAARGPLLLVAGGSDHTVPASMTRANLKRYKGSPATTDIVELPDRGHSLTMDSGWEEVAGTALNWLRKHLP